MKKLFFTFVLALLCVTAAWAGFTPETGKLYALKVVDAALYLDIQTLGINEPNAGGTTNNISLNTKPCIIYFAEGTTDNSKWIMQNVNGGYAMQASSRNWNATIGTTAYEWSINEPAGGVFTIARKDGGYINVDTKTAGQPLYCDKGTGMQFTLVEYSTYPAGSYTLQSSTGTYLNFTTASGSAASFRDEPTEFYIKPSANTLFFEEKGSDGSYIGSTHGWNVTTDFSLWSIGAPDEEGSVYITRASDASSNLGSDRDTNAGTGIFTNVGPACNKWFIEGTYNVATAGTVSNGKYTFTSAPINYYGACNKIRFTLTESGAFYKNGAKRLSFDSFVLYNSTGDEVELAQGNFSGNNGKVYDNVLDGANGTYMNSAWDTSDATDDWFEISLDAGVDLGGAFSFSFVTENTTMNAKSFEVKTSFEKVADYTFVIDAPVSASVEALYDGNTIESGTFIAISSFNPALLLASDLAGYTWSVVVDDANRTVKLVYTEAPDTVNPAAVVALINRIGGEGADAKFKFVLSPSMNSKQEVFSINGEDGKILIKGTTISAITTGIGWYLQHHARINIAWNSLNEKTVSGAAYADLSSIPVPTAEDTHTSDAMYRYYLNTCAFGYSMTSWTWKRWQQEIDWMALHGINMPLQLVGLEEVWRKFLTMEENGERKYGYTDTEAKAFVAGPAFIAWWAMNNLQGWGGTASGTKSGGTWEGAGGVQDDAWYARQKKLAKQICDRQRELGMQPVIPGWSGMVPTNFASKSGYATRGNGGNWAGDFVRPLLLSVSNAKYGEIAADYYACLHDVMGESQYYSMDPFHEGGGAGTMEDYEAMYAAMEAAKPGSQWVIQQWQWSATQRYSLTAVPAGRLIVLDLFADGSPAFDSYNGYAPQDAVFSTIPNFGGRSGLMGRLTNLTDNYFKYKAKYASIKGIGAAPEAIEQTPVTYDLIFQLPWMNGVKPDVVEWVNNYAIARYGQNNEEIKEAWSLLRQGVLNYGADGIQGPVEDVWAARPNLTANKASTWGKTLNDAMGTYTKARQQMLIDAVYKLLSQNEALNFADGSIYESNYNYDLVEFGGGVLADYAYYLLLGINEAKKASNTALYEARRDAFLQLILDVDKFKGTNLNFRLGKWTQEARAAAAEVEGATTATPDWYEYNNARTIVSTWSSPNTNLNDYSYRSWQGLLKDLYYPRWKHYFDNSCTTTQYGFFEWNWAHGRVHSVGQTSVSTVKLSEGQQGHSGTYDREPEGNTVDAAREVLGKYIIPVAMSDGTYYAYRYLNNDLTSKVTIIASVGTVIDLSSYFGSLEGVTLTGDFIDGNASDLSAVAVKSNAADGSHTGTITLSDGTVLTFAVVINPAYYGVYGIDYQNNGDVPVFVAYNTDADNSKNVGYKLIAAGTYTADAVADALFTITPSGSGFSLSAQGKYLKQPTLGGWNHIMFSNDKSEAGAYLFEETSVAGVFKMRSTGSGINYVNDYDKLVFGNDNSTKENLSTFKFTQVDVYTFTIPAEGLATLCLPFNVILPAGITACEIIAEGIVYNGEEAAYTYKLSEIAGENEIVKAGTPVIVKGKAGEYNLSITMSDSGAKKASATSILQGNFVKETLTQGNDTKIFMLDGTTFAAIEGNEDIAANSCHLAAAVDATEITPFVDTPGSTGIEEVYGDAATERGVAYDLFGRPVKNIVNGIYIIDGKKVVY